MCEVKFSIFPIPNFKLTIMKKMTTFQLIMFMICSTAYSQMSWTTTSQFTFNTNYGNIQLGPWDATYGHIFTDRARFMFNKDLFLQTGGLSSTLGVSLYFKTDGINRMFINSSNGYTGIGTTSPTEMLSVNGNISSTNLKVTDAGGVWFGSSSSPTGSFFIGHNSNSNTYCDINNGNLFFRRSVGLSNQGAIMGLQKDGTITMGVWERYDNNVTDTQGARLMVNGGILCEKIKVIADVPNSDHVFKPTYRLMPLSELKQFVTENHHLPEVPSAQEFQENGYSLGQMDDLLLRKVEELTLYIIQLQEELKKQQEVILELNNKVNN